MEPVELVVCMGSACFSRGNTRTLELIQGYLKEHKLEQRVRVTGTLCQDQCRTGPNVSLQGECFCAREPNEILALLEERIKAGATP